jgi:hypothetical protein
VVHRSADYRRYSDDQFDNYSRKRQWTSKKTCTSEVSGENRNGSLRYFFLMAFALSARKNTGIQTKKSFLIKKGFIVPAWGPDNEANNQNLYPPLHIKH